MFFNPFSWWFILLVILPFTIIGFILYLPAYPLSLIGLGKYYKRGHYYFFEHIQQFSLQPKNYTKNIKGINKHIIGDAKDFFN